MSTKTPSRAGLPSTWYQQDPILALLYEEWEYWCANAMALLPANAVEMSNEVATAFMQSCLFEGADYENSAGFELMEGRSHQDLPKTANFPLLVFDQHAAKLNCKVTTSVRLFMALLIPRSPGELVMYVHLLKYVQMKDNYRITMMQKLADAFPLGFLNRDSLRQMWEAQKTVQQHNLLDKVSFAEGAAA